MTSARSLHPLGLGFLLRKLRLKSSREFTGLQGFKRQSSWHFEQCLACNGITIVPIIIHSISAKARTACISLQASAGFHTRSEKLVWLSGSHGYSQNKLSSATCNTSSHWLCWFICPTWICKHGWLSATPWNKGPQIMVQGLSPPEPELILEESPISFPGNL